MGTTLVEVNGRIYSRSKNQLATAVGEASMSQTPLFLLEAKYLGKALLETWFFLRVHDSAGLRVRRGLMISVKAYVPVFCSIRTRTRALRKKGACREGLTLQVGEALHSPQPSPGPAWHGNETTDSGPIFLCLVLPKEKARMRTRVALEVCSVCETHMSGAITCFQTCNSPSPY